MVLASHPIPLSCALPLIFLIPSHLFPSSGCPTLDRQATSQRMEANTSRPGTAPTGFNFLSGDYGTCYHRSISFLLLSIHAPACLSHDTTERAPAPHFLCSIQAFWFPFVSFWFPPPPPLLRLHVLHAGDLSETFVLWLRAFVTQQPKLSASL